MIKKESRTWKISPRQFQIFLANKTCLPAHETIVKKLQAYVINSGHFSSISVSTIFPSMNLKYKNPGR